MIASTFLVKSNGPKCQRPFVTMRYIDQFFLCLSAQRSVMLMMITLLSHCDYCGGNVEVGKKRCVGVHPPPPPPTLLSSIFQGGPSVAACFSTKAINFSSKKPYALSLHISIKFEWHPPHKNWHQIVSNYAKVYISEKLCHLLHIFFCLMCSKRDNGHSCLKVLLLTDNVLVIICHHYFVIIESRVI